MATTIRNVQIFDGEQVLDETSVTIAGTTITALGGTSDGSCDIIDGAGATLLPGFIDAHVHTSIESLALALAFGVTTELEMQGTNTRNHRADITDNDTVADVRSSGFGITPPGGHPSELFPSDARPDHDGGTVIEEDEEASDDLVMPFASTPEQAVAYIPQLVAAGSDYIKFMIDDGTVEGAPGLPMLDAATVRAGVGEAHRLGMLTVAHTLTVDASVVAIEAGMDGLAHLFMDRPHTPDIVRLIAESGAFVVPCIVLNASMMGQSTEAFAADFRVRSRLEPKWLVTLRGAFNKYPQARLDDVLATVKALHDAGVDLLTGTDVSVPFPFLGGMAHGASVHHELQLLVQAGLTPIEALRAATSVPARRFNLNDRGRIAAGLRADLLLVQGDPTVTISDTLSITDVWRRGTRHTHSLA